MTDHSFILNRLPASSGDGWIQLLPVGSYPGVRHDKRRVTQVFDRAAFERIINRFEAQRAAQGDDFPGLLFGREHWEEAREGDTSAYGWIRNMEIRDDGLYAMVEWTDQGRQAIENRRYKFHSPVILTDASDAVIGVAGASFTNRQNLKGLRPINNRESPVNPNEGEVPMKSIALALGLAEDADETAVLNSVKALQAANQDLAGQIENRAKSDLEAEADAFVQTHAERIADGEIVKAQYIQNKEATIALFGAVKTASAPASPGVVHNRAQTKVPETRIAEDGGSQARADKIEAAVQEYRVANKCTYRDAYSVIERTRPELFKQAQ